jgi:polar amino acid transport system substrate-binding protein
MLMKMKACLFVLAVLLSMLCASAQKTFAADPAQESAFARIMRTGTLKCGYAVWYPNLVVDPNTKQMSGISYDLMNEIGRRTGIKIEWTQEAGFGSAEQDLKAGKYDVLCADVCFEARRTKEAYFSRPFYSAPVYLTARKEDARFDKDTSAANAPDVTITTYANTIFDTYKNEFFPKAKGVDVSELGADVDTMMALVTKKADAAFNNQISVDRFNKANGDKAKTVGAPLSSCNGSFMMAHGESDLKYLIDSGIEETTARGDMAKIMKKYLPEGERYWSLPPVTLR